VLAFVVLAIFCLLQLASGNTFEKTAPPGGAFTTSTTP